MGGWYLNVSYAVLSLPHGKSPYLRPFPGPENAFDTSKLRRIPRIASMCKLPVGNAPEGQACFLYTPLPIAASSLFINLQGPG